MSAGELAARYGRLVSSICRRMIRDEETARDAVQEAWVEILRGLPSFRGESSESTWVYSITARTAMRHSAKEQVYSTRVLRGYFHGPERELPQDAGVDSGVERQAWIREMCDKCLTGILHCLDNETRLAYISRDMAEVPYDVIARVLGKDERAVRKMVSRARLKLRNFLNDECALANPRAKCKCRMRRWVEDIDLPQEYERLRRTVRRMSVFRATEAILPGKNFLE